MSMIVKPLLLHELGHILNGDLNNNKTGKQIREERASLITLEIVDPRELKTDKFAAENSDYLGTIRALYFLREERRNMEEQEQILH